MLLLLIATNGENWETFIDSLGWPSSEWPYRWWHRPGRWGGVFCSTRRWCCRPCCCCQPPFLRLRQTNKRKKKATSHPAVSASLRRSCWGTSGSTRPWARPVLIRLWVLPRTCSHSSRQLFTWPEWFMERMSASARKDKRKTFLDFNWAVKLRPTETHTHTHNFEWAWTSWFFPSWLVRPGTVSSPSSGISRAGAAVSTFCKTIFSSPGWESCSPPLRRQRGRAIKFKNANRSDTAQVWRIVHIAKGTNVERSEPYQIQTASGTVFCPARACARRRLAVTLG